ncbi:MAG TPA: hypothetical protein VFK09_07335 [Gemmatimonadales bacterium]|jgi:hypothetical protein|nr:hypothetical protein [Gemmatimonadales bacterium]
MTDSAGAHDTTVQLCDPSGRPLGRVVGPAGAPLLGRGAGTVLLQRPLPGHDRPFTDPVRSS